MTASRMPSNHPPRRVSILSVLPQQPAHSPVAAPPQALDPPVRRQLIKCHLHLLRRPACEQVRIPQDLIDRHPFKKQLTVMFPPVHGTWRRPLCDRSVPCHGHTCYPRFTTMLSGPRDTMTSDGSLGLGFTSMCGAHAGTKRKSPGPASTYSLNPSPNRTPTRPLIT